MKAFKSLVYWFVFTALICCNDRPIEKKEIYSSKSEMEDIIGNISRIDTIPFLDLSGKKIEALPDLSVYNIQSIDLSNNSITKIRHDYLPKNIISLNLYGNKIDTLIGYEIPNSLKHLNLTKNNLKSVTLKLNKDSSGLVKINLSSNKITYCHIVANNLKHLNLSNNELEYLHLNPIKQMEYLNISSNLKFSNIIEFDPKFIDTIIKKDILNNKPLIPKWKTIKREPID